MSFQRVTPTGLRRQCVLDDLADYDEPTRTTLTRDVEALDAEVLRWIDLRQEPIRRLVGIGSNVLIAMVNGMPATEERALAYANVETYCGSSEAFNGLINDCPALAYPYTNRHISGEEFVYRLRIIEIAFGKIDPTLEAIYLELYPQCELRGEALHSVIRDWTHENLDALTEISRMLAAAEECGDAPTGTVAAMRASLTEQLPGVSLAARSLMERSATLRRATLEPPRKDSKFKTSLTLVINALIP